MSGSATQLYERDFVRWTEEQSRALRDAAGIGTNLPLDWENLAEEIESLGQSQRHELRSRIAVILEHLLKLEHSTALIRGADGGRQSFGSGPMSSVCWKTAPASGATSPA